jgi:hypothetical protein
MREHVNPLIKDTAQRLPPPRIARRQPGTHRRITLTYKTSTPEECRWARKASSYKSQDTKILHRSHQNYMFSYENESNTMANKKIIIKIHQAIFMSYIIQCILELCLYPTRSLPGRLYKCSYFFLYTYTSEFNFFYYHIFITQFIHKNSME